MMYRLIAATALMLAATPAWAQEPDTAIPTMTGPRVEARVGWDRAKASVGARVGDQTLRYSGSESDVSYGGEVGYDLDLGRSVIGGYAGVEKSSVRFCTDLVDGCLKAGRNFTLGVRGGAKLGSTVLLYAKGGYSNGRITLAGGDPTVEEEDGRNFDGFHVGGGVEAGFRGGLYGRLEYVYTDYKDVRARDADMSVRLGVTRHQLVYAMGYRF